MPLAQIDTTDAATPAQYDSLATPLEPNDGTLPDEDVPAFKHLISAIFVPLKQDLLTPPALPKDEVERLQMMRASLDANEKGVRSNLAWMFEREGRRVLAHAKRTRALADPINPRAIDWDEGEELIANLKTPAPPPSRPCHMSKETLEQHSQPLGPVRAPDLTAHEYTVRQMLVTARDGSYQMERYSTIHIKPIRERLNARLEEENKKRV